MIALAGPMCAFDTETTGINVETDRIVTACTALLRPNTPTWDQHVTSHLIAVDVDIPGPAEAVHGISTKFAREHGQPAPEVLNTLATDLTRAMLANIPIVGANIAFDLTILDRELRRNELPTIDERLSRPIRPVVDVLVIDRWLDKFRKGKRKLTDLCEHYGVPLVEGDAHNATFDALAAARIIFRMRQLCDMDYKALLAAEGHPTYPAFHRLAHRVVAGNTAALASMTLDELHEAQVEWRREQCDGLRAYLTAKGDAHNGVPGDWPMIPWARTNEAVLTNG